jgi:hypothetical protein
MQHRYKREFKVQVVGDIGSGLMGWRESACEYGMPASTIRDWLERYGDRESACSWTHRARTMSCTSVAISDVICNPKLTAQAKWSHGQCPACAVQSGSAS